MNYYRFKSLLLKEGWLSPAYVGVDENGIIHVAYYGKYVGDHYPVNEIVKWASQK